MSLIDRDFDLTWKRLFPHSVWTNRVGLTIIFWSLMASLLLAAQFLCVLLVVDLFDHRGQFNLTPAELEQASALFGPSLGINLSDEENVPTAAIYRIDNRGILETLWHFRDRMWTKPLIALYRNVEMLRDNSSALLFLLIIGAVLGLIRGMMIAHCKITSENEASRISNQLRHSIHRQALRLGPSDLENQKAKQAYEIFTKQMTHVREGISQWLFSIPIQVTTLIVLFLLATMVNPRLFFQMVVPLVGCWLLLEREFSRLRYHQKITEAEREHQSSLLGESLFKTRLVRGFGMEDFELSQFQKHLSAFQSTGFRIRRGEAFSRWLCWGLVLVCVTVVVFLIGVKVLLPEDHPQSLRLAQVTLLGLCFGFSYVPLSQLRILPNIRKSTAIAADRAYRFLSEVPEVGQAVGAKFLEPLSKTISFENVSYKLNRAEEEILLDQLELRIDAGKTIVLGASSMLEARALLYMLPRFIEPQTGRVLIDGEDIAWVTLESLRAETIYVGQDDQPFTGTVLENIICGETRYTLSDAVNAAKRVHAHNFIQRLPQGYDTVLGEHGVDLDAGQIYRLGLARAILRKPALLILEEPQVDLSEETKSMIDDAYNYVFSGRTVILVASRMQTIRRSDQIILLNQGKVVAMGPHQDLLAKNDFYRHWEYVRFNTFRRGQTST